MIFTYFYKKKNMNLIQLLNIFMYKKLSKLHKNLVLRIFTLEIYTKRLIKRMIFVVYSSLFLSLLMSLSLTHLRCIWDGLLVGSLVNIKEADDGLLWGAEKEQRLITATISMSSTFKGAQPGNGSREAKGNSFASAVVNCSRKKLLHNVHWSQTTLTK